MLQCPSISIEGEARLKASHGIRDRTSKGKARRPENASGEGLLSWNIKGRGLWLGAEGKFDRCCSVGGGGGAEDRPGSESGRNCKRQAAPIEKI
ncbi:hypothetical protein HAX54_043073 [Datura stramonium]|uniref:Uncharacterized protein n=1 Tax=Datura stramonium TaxID=4076 RepID=A0ABS8SN13_DATST|nr:hypothetical protein [Datura stramonium]